MDRFNGAFDFVDAELKQSKEILPFPTTSCCIPSTERLGRCVPPELSLVMLELDSTSPKLDLAALELESAVLELDSVMEVLDFRSS
jgi:hypothetical protein